MGQFSRRLCRLLLAGVSCGLAGCGSSDEPTVPSYQPGPAASRALELHDENKNGSIEGAELARCPELQFALSRIDTDGNGKLTEAEIRTRLEFYKKLDAAIISSQVRILRNGQPLPGAKITFDPPEYLKPTLKPASGMTNASGQVGLQLEDLPYPGVQVGLYRVRVSLVDPSGQETIATRFNSETTFGAEVASGVPEQERGYVFDLK